MPKLKTKKGIAKRFKITKGGKITCKHAGKGHLLSKKSKRRKRNLSQKNVLGHISIKTIKKTLPYG